MGLVRRSRLGMRKRKAWWSGGMKMRRVGVLNGIAKGTGWDRIGSYASSQNRDVKND